MSDEHEPSDRLLDLIFAALDVGIETVRATNDGMHPFLMTPGDDKPAFTRFVGDSMAECIRMAQEAAEQLPDDVPAYAIAIDGYLPTDEEKFDAMIVEGAERGEPVGFVFAQRYRPARGKRPFEVVGRPAIIKEVPSRFPTLGDTASRCLIIFRDSGYTLDDASRMLSDRGLTVTPQRDALAVRSNDGPTLFIRLARGMSIQNHAAWLGRGTAHAKQLGECDAWFEITFKDLVAVLDEINTLIDVQASLQDATQGFQYNSWNNRLVAPGE